MSDANTITLNLCRIIPSMINIDVVGASIDGGRNLHGSPQSIDISGGGLVAVELSGIILRDRDGHRYWNEVAGLLAGSVRDIFVPLWTDPERDPAAADTGTIGAAALHATQVSITADAPNMFAGSWFAIHHVNPQGWRAYRIITLDAPTGSVYPATIRPALRRAVTAGEIVRFNRPVATLKLAPGSSMPWVWQAPGALSQDMVMSLIEAF